MLRLCAVLCFYLAVQPTAASPDIGRWLSSLVQAAHSTSGSFSWPEWSSSSINEVYEHAVGDAPTSIHGIPEYEREQARAANVNLLYGSVPAAGIKQVFADKLLNGSGHEGQMLADMGHGAGQVSLYAFLNFHLRQVVGVEYSRVRWNASCGVLRRAAEKAKELKVQFPAESAVYFINGDFSAIPVPLGQYPMVFMETNLGPELERKMHDFIGNQVPVGSRVLTFANLFGSDGDFKEIRDEEGVLTTWSKTHKFHYWEKMSAENLTAKSSSFNNDWLSQVPQDMMCSLVGGEYNKAVGTQEEKQEKQEAEINGNMEKSILAVEKALNETKEDALKSKHEVQFAFQKKQNETDKAAAEKLSNLEMTISKAESMTKIGVEKMRNDTQTKIEELQKKEEETENALRTQYDKQREELKAEIKSQEELQKSTAKQGELDLKESIKRIEAKVAEAEKTGTLLIEQANKEASAQKEKLKRKK